MPDTGDYIGFVGRTNSLWIYRPSWFNKFLVVLIVYTCFRISPYLVLCARNIWRIQSNRDGNWKPFITNATFINVRFLRENFKKENEIPIFNPYIHYYMIDVVDVMRSICQHSFALFHPLHSISNPYISPLYFPIKFVFFYPFM